VDFKILRSSGIRSWLSNPPAKFFLKLIRQIFPFKTINILGKIVFKQELLGTGFGAGFLFQNIFIIAKNEN
jgi:hypothetical protein